MAFIAQKRVLVTRRIPDPGLKLLEQAGFDVVVSSLDRPLKKKEIITQLKKGFDGVISLLTDTIDSEVLHAGGARLKVVANYAVGYDNIDLATAKDLGVRVCNAPGTSDISVAETALALMLAVAHHIETADDFVRAGLYKGWNPDLFVGTSLFGKTLGIIGTGAIGSELAKMAHHGLSMNVIYTDIVKNKHIETTCAAQQVSLEELLTQADVVSLHVPLLKSTHHMIGLKQLEMMKTSAYLINTARGAVIDEAALVVALKKKVIRGAALDVYEHEPELTPGLTSLENVILTPHIASATTESREHMARVTCQNVIDALTGKQPSGLVG